MPIAIKWNPTKTTDEAKTTARHRQHVEQQTAAPKKQNAAPPKKRKATKQPKARKRA